MQSDNHYRPRRQSIIGISVAPPEPSIRPRLDRTNARSSFTNGKGAPKTNEAKKKAKAIISMVSRKEDDPATQLENALNARRYALAVSLSPGIALKTAMETKAELRSVVDEYEDTNEFAQTIFPALSDEWKSEDLMVPEPIPASVRRGSLMPGLGGDSLLVPGSNPQSRRPSKSIPPADRSLRENLKLTEMAKRNEKGELDKINYIYNMLEQKRNEFREAKRHEIRVHAERARRKLASLQKHREISQQKRQIENEALKQEWRDIQKEVRCRPTLNPKVGVSKMLDFYRHMTQLQHERSIQQSQKKEVHEKAGDDLKHPDSKQDLLKDILSKATTPLNSTVQLAGSTATITIPTPKEEKEECPDEEKRVDEALEASTSQEPTTRKGLQLLNIPIPQLKTLNMEISMSKASYDCWKGHSEAITEEKKLKRRNQLIGEMAGSILKFKEASQKMFETEEKYRKPEAVLETTNQTVEANLFTIDPVPSRLGTKDVKAGTVEDDVDSDEERQAAEMLAESARQMDKLNQSIIRKSRRSCYINSHHCSSTEKENTLITADTVPANKVERAGASRLSTGSQKSFEHLSDKGSDSDDEYNVGEEIFEQTSNSTPTSNESKEVLSGTLSAQLPRRPSRVSTGSESIPISSIPSTAPQPDSISESLSYDGDDDSSHDIQDEDECPVVEDESQEDENEVVSDENDEITSKEGDESEIAELETPLSPRQASPSTPAPQRTIIPLTMDDVLQDDTVQIKPALHAPHYYWKTPFIL